MSELVFLKLGGSLITDKTVPYTTRPEILKNLSRQIRESMDVHPDLSLVLGHGSGSFGHTAAKEHGTRQGVSTPAQWRGFAEVWYQAATLNRYVMEALHSAGVPAIALAPVSAVNARGGRLNNWDLTSLRAALKNRLVPVVYGDVIFDTEWGGTILSTEDLFEHLAYQLKPDRILLAGLEAGVWADFPARQQLIKKITPASFEQVKNSVGASNGADVTGGMESKTRQMLALAQSLPGLTAQIYSGETPESTLRALLGKNEGTIISAA